MHRRPLKRPITVAAGLVLLVGIGTAMALDARARHDGHVVSRWSGGGVRLVYGFLAADPERGFVRLKQRGKKPVFFKTPEGAGALRLVSHESAFSWRFRSSHGALALLHAGIYGDIKIPPSFEFLGRRLDPAKLGPIGARGVAVPVEWWDGKKQRSVVVLVQQAPARHGSFGNGWKVVGYLPGFTTPRIAALSKLLPGTISGWSRRRSCSNRCAAPTGGTTRST